jgi:hypothetical protein
VSKAIHILPNGERDWVVREVGGRELGHYATRAEAEAVGNKLARRTCGPRGKWQAAAVKAAQRLVCSRVRKLSWCVDRMAMRDPMAQFS